MVFIENNRCMFCARGGDGKSLKNRSGNPGQKLPCIQEIHTNYQHDLDNPKDLKENNRSLYNEPSDSYFYFTKSFRPAATNTSAPTNVPEDQTQKYVYQVMPKAEFKSTQNETSSDYGRFSYNWVDTTPTVVSVMRSVDFDKANNKTTAKSKSDSSTEMFNYKNPKCIKPMQNRTKIRHNIKLGKINMSKRKGALEANSTSSCNDSLRSAMNNLGSFFEDLLKTTLNTDPELDTAVKNESKCESNSSLTWSHCSSKDNIEEQNNTVDNTDLKKQARGTVSWDFTTDDTSRSVMTDFVDWADDAGNEEKKLMHNKTSKVHKPQWSRPATATSKESLYTEINASSFINLRRTSKTSKRKRSFDFPNIKILTFRKKSNKFDAPKKLKPRRMSNKKRMISYLKKRLSDGDRKSSFDNGPQSEFFKSLKNIAFLKKRLNREKHFFDEPKASASKKRKCSKARGKFLKNK